LKGKTILLALVAAALVFASVTLVALEGSEVVVLRTVAVDGTLRRTRAWVADYEGAAHIEAANPERELLRDIAAHPSVELERQGAVLNLRASVLAQPAGHDLIRALLRQKYGWKDAWIGYLTDTSASLAVRLDAE